MKFFWFLLFSAQPWTLLVAMLGLFGKEAEEAADEWCQIVGAALVVIILVILVVVALFFLGKVLGLWAVVPQ